MILVVKGQFHAVPSVWIPVGTPVQECVIREVVVFGFQYLVETLTIRCNLKRCVGAYLEFIPRLCKVGFWSIFIAVKYLVVSCLPVGRASH